MNKFKCNVNRNTVCVFAVIDGASWSHLANIDMRTNRIYTTQAGYELLATDNFKSNHCVSYFDEAETYNAIKTYNEREEFKDSLFRKFDVAVNFAASELQNIIRMCSREFEF